MNTYVDPLTPERKAELAVFSPHARFEIPSDKTGWEYPVFLQARMIDMLEASSPKNDNARYMRSFERGSGEESGISHVHIRDRQLYRGCKLYWYDGENNTPFSWKKGMLLRDHEDMGVYVVEEIFTLADAFAQFLAEKKISFTLFVRHRNGREDIVRAKFPV